MTREATSSSTTRRTRTPPTPSCSRAWTATPGFPTPLGVLRAVDAPRYEDAMNEQVKDGHRKKGKGDLGELLQAGDTWGVQ